MRRLIILAVLMMATAIPVWAKPKAKLPDSTAVVLKGSSEYFLEIIALSMSNGNNDTLIIERGQEAYLDLDAYFGRPKYKNRNFEFRETHLIAYEHLAKWKKAKVQWTIRYFGDKAMTSYMGQRQITKKFKKWTTTDWVLPAKAPQNKGEAVGYLELTNQTAGSIFTPMLEWKNKRSLEIEPGRTKRVRIEPGCRLLIRGVVNFGEGWIGESPKRSRIAPNRRLSDNGIARPGINWQGAEISVAPASNLVVTNDMLKQTLARKLLIVHYGLGKVRITGDIETEIGPNGQQEFTVYQGVYLQVNAAFYKEGSAMAYANRQYSVRPVEKAYYHWDRRVNAHLDIRN